MSLMLQHSLDEDYNKEGWQNDPELNYRVLYKFNFVNWITLLLNGENPHNTNLKPILEKLKMNMLAYETSHPSGNPYALDTIHTMFNTIYNL